MMQIKLEKFAGPLSLLLKIIEKEEMDITEVSLAKIADQYVEYIRNAANIDPDEMADFLVVAARLLLIKSRALLPYLYPEEEKEITELEEQLKMYKEFIIAAQNIEKIIGKKKFMFAREFNRRVILSNANLFAPPQGLRADELALIFQEVVSRVQLPEKLAEETLNRKISIEDKILTIQQMLIDRIKFSFNKVLQDANSKTEIIVSFLAMLELIKQKNILVTQAGLFEEILINRYEKD